MGQLLGCLGHRREYDAKLIGKNLKRLRKSKHLSVEQVREYLGLGSVQAIYKYEAGRNYPQADLLLALLELYDADYVELICEPLTQCRALKEGSWMLFAPTEHRPGMMVEIVVDRELRKNGLTF